MLGRAQQFYAQLFVMAHADATDEDPEEFLLEFVACIVRRLMDVHIYNHHSEYRGLVSAPFRSLPLFLDLLERDTNTTLRRHAHLKDHVAEMFEDVVQHGLEGEVFDQDVVALDRPITPYFIWVPGQGIPATMAGIEGPTFDVEDILGIPPIPSHSAGVIAYFCKSDTFRDIILWKWALKIWVAGRMDDDLHRQINGLLLSLGPSMNDMTSQAWSMMNASILESLYVN